MHQALALVPRDIGAGLPSALPGALYSAAGLLHKLIDPVFGEILPARLRTGRGCCTKTDENRLRMTIRIRKPEQDDVQALGRIAEVSGLFPAEFMPDMIRTFLQGSENEVWLCAEDDGQLSGFCFARAEEMADSVWNMLALGVSPAHQRSGTGSALTDALETALLASGGRMLIADTSGTDEFESARNFYAKQGYTAEARIRNFWAAGDDKVTFTKALSS